MGFGDFISVFFFCWEVVGRQQQQQQQQQRLAEAVCRTHTHTHAHSHARTRSHTHARTHARHMRARELPPAQGHNTAPCHVPTWVSDIHGARVTHGSLAYTNAAVATGDGRVCVKNGRVACGVWRV